MKQTLIMSNLSCNRLFHSTEYSETDSESSSSERKNTRGYDGYYKMNRTKTPTTHKRMRKKRTAIPVQPPKVPFGTYVTPPEIPMLYQKMKTDKKLTGIEKGKTCCLNIQKKNCDDSNPFF